MSRARCLLGIVPLVAACFGEQAPLEDDAGLDAATDIAAPKTDVLDATTSTDHGAPFDGPGPDATFDATLDAAPDAGGCATCGPMERCMDGRCVPALGPCRTNDDCPGDSYCSSDTCVPYGTPASHTNDPTCRRTITVDRLLPEVQCEWNGPAAGDPTENLHYIYSTPVVADLNLDGDARRIDPTIVAITYNDVGGQRRGPLRLFSGRTCEELARIGVPNAAGSEATEPAPNAQIAIGDLDGDLRTTGDVVIGHPEIVTLKRGSNDVTTAFGVQPSAQLIAYRIADAPGATPPFRLERAWVGRRCEMTGEPAFDLAPDTIVANHGPTLLDVTGDDAPEVLVGRYVFSSGGCVLNPGQALPNYAFLGSLTTAADVDHDGQPELVMHDGTFRWDDVGRAWVTESYFSPSPEDRMQQRLGLPALADFGRYAAPAGTPAGARRPEVAIVSAENQESTSSTNTGTATVRIQTITGAVVFGPVPLVQLNMAWPRGGLGGAPTAADFDGDGWPEIGVAGASSYAVYDPDCATTPPPERPGGTCARPADEPVRPGVLWARQVKDESSSSTGSSVFDFDADGRAEVVYRDECYLRVFDGRTGALRYSAGASSGTGYELPVIADVDGDFATEIVVARTYYPGSGCPETDPLAPAGTTPATFASRTGFVVLRDPMDRWAASRPIWNQHGYHVTNVTDDGRIPSRATVRRHWDEEGLNNFRQQAQGALGSVALADLTVAVANASALCTASGAFDLAARVCNRGTNPVADGAVVRFSTAGVDGGAGATLCEVPTTTLLAVGTCTMVRCTATIAAGAGRRVTVRIDPDDRVADCHRGNNRGEVTVADCPG